MTDLEAKAVSLRYVEWAREHDTAWDTLIETIQYLTHKEIVDMSTLHERPKRKKHQRRLTRSQKSALVECSRAVDKACVAARGHTPNCSSP